MYVAQLSALDIGSFVMIKAVPKGARYTQWFTGYLVEVHHNKSEGRTAVRVVSSGIGWTEDRPKMMDRWLKNPTQYGASKQFYFGEEVEILHPPHQKE